MGRFPAARGQTAAGESVNAALAHFDAAAMARADRLIDEAIAAGRCPGAVLLVGRGDAILYEKAYGHRALKPTLEPMTTDTVFDLASLSKPIGTSTSVMLLAERGILKLEDPVAKYLPAFGANGKEHITIADLLLHQGGLTPDNDLADYAGGAEAAMARTLAIAPTWKPRSRFAYSDVGFIVLGELVHRVSGKPLDAFAREEIFRPLGMVDTAYNPPDALKARCAPTEQRDGRWMIGDVHDPRAHALGGVAGHAGLFSTAEDLSRFCRMILNNGALGGARILKQTTVAEWTQPRVVPGGDHRTYGFDVHTGYAGIRGDRFEKGATFGHTGFTGTALWIDPLNRCYFILLANSVHPTGKGNVLKLRHDVATEVGEALLGNSSGTHSGTGILPVSNSMPATKPSAPSTQHSSGKAPLIREDARNLPAPNGVPTTQSAPPATQPDMGRMPMPRGILLGIDVLRHGDFRALDGRKVALITNHTGRDAAGTRTADLLAGAKNLKLVRLFSPEHGIDGVLDEKIGDTIDAKTGLKVFSLYGSSQKPTLAMLEGIDTLVFDIQDVGTRFYTYISTLGLCMQAAAEHKLKFVVLDRPNPNTGLVADGPLADAAHVGFTAFGPLPLVHGMTVGELARFYNAEFKINCDLDVIPMDGWRRLMWWDETGLMWINPSPNLRNPTAALLYPAVGLLESTNVSVGRGTDQPFEQFGAPWIDGRRLAAALNEAKISGVRFVPVTFTPTGSKFAKQACQGVYVQVIDRNAFEPARAGVAIAWQVKALFGEKFESKRVANMLGNTRIAEVLDAEREPAAAPAAWATDIAAFRATREKYLIYP